MTFRKAPMYDKFIDQVVRCRETEYHPIKAPVDPHPTRGDWVNHGVEVYKKAFGAEEYARYSPNDVPFPMPDDTPAERKKLRWRAFKAKLEFGGKLVLGPAPRPAPTRSRLSRRAR